MLTEAPAGIDRGSVGLVVTITIGLESGVEINVTFPEADEFRLVRLKSSHAVEPLATTSGQFTHPASCPDPSQPIEAPPGALVYTMKSSAPTMRSVPVLWELNHPSERPERMAAATITAPIATTITTPRRPSRRERGRRSCKSLDPVGSVGDCTVWIQALE